MVIHTMMPVVSADELEKAVNMQFGCEIHDITNLLFGDNYYNDSYQGFWYDELETYEECDDMAEEEIRLRNLVRTYLQDTIPEFSRVLIDVSW